MNSGRLFIAASILLLLSLPARAHQVSNLEHTHVYQQTAYGKFRQGHAVSGQYGNILIWSAKPYASSRNSNNVRIARPAMIKQAPPGPFLESGARFDATRNYGKQPKRDYGN